MSMKDKQVYSVSQLSQKTGVTVRTLHHYDKLGLLKPIRRQDNGYREYHQKHLLLLQQIIIYRELDFSINDISALLNADDFDMLSALDKQKSMLLMRQKTTQHMIDSIEASMTIINGKRNAEILFEGIPKEKIEHWDKMILDQAGQDALDDWMKTLGQLSQEDAEYEKQENNKFLMHYAHCMHLPIDAKEVQALVKCHYELLNRFLYKTHSDFKGIGYNGYLIFAEQVLVSEIHRDMVEYYQVGMAEHLNKAMVYFSHNTLKDQLSAFRQLGSEYKIS